MNNESTQQPQNLIFARTIYLSVWCAIAIFALLCECNILPIGYVKANAQTAYALNMLCIVLTLACTWGSLRLFAFKGIRSKLNKHPQHLQQWNMLRTSILPLAILVNLITYYGVVNSRSALFCLLITLTGFVFCWPKHDEIN